ncbi:type III-B CRISPR module RAMP protein Cmr4 [Microcoleus sp. Pol11C3]|uniref:type III-B CRISPR module RAMP protein Cmr4 n=1 Tax=Microcoleus sp. Pol11C3 TaxID=3055390 RepID=UPI002FD0F920
MTNLAYLYLLSPLHTGGTSQEGNLVGIARESHTDLPYLPSSSIRGRLRAATPESDRIKLWGNTIDDVTSATVNSNQTPESAQNQTTPTPTNTSTAVTNLIQGTLWVGDAALLWFPVASLSHGVVWISSPFLLRRWMRLINNSLPMPEVGSFSKGNIKNLYLKDAIFKAADLKKWNEKTQWRQYLPTGSEETNTISQVLVLSDQDCQVLIQSSLWRQVKVKLDEKKNVDGGFRYEEAIPPENLMFFPWGTTVATNGKVNDASTILKTMLQKKDIVWQFGGQESLGRGFVELWSN